MSQCEETEPPNILKMITIYDKRLPQEYKEAINAKIPSLVWQSLSISNKKQVYESILYHPDIYLFQLTRDTFVCAPCIANQLQNINLIKGLDDPHSKYPYSARFNAVRIGDFIFHNLKYADPVIIDAAKKMGLKPVNVPQGYARCSVVPVRNNAIITQDNGIAKIAKGLGLGVLLISGGHVLLPGEKYGFLGGATGILPDGIIIFIGNLDLHPDSKEIKKFLKKHKTEYISLENLPLYDAGTIISL